MKRSDSSHIISLDNILIKNQSTIDRLKIGEGYLGGGKDKHDTFFPKVILVIEYLA